MCCCTSSGGSVNDRKVCGVRVTNALLILTLIEIGAATACAALLLCCEGPPWLPIAVILWWASVALACAVFLLFVVARWSWVKNLARITLLFKTVHQLAALALIGWSAYIVAQGNQEGEALLLLFASIALGSITTAVHLVARLALAPQKSHQVYNPESDSIPTIA